LAKDNAVTLIGTARIVETCFPFGLSGNIVDFFVLFVIVGKATFLKTVTISSKLREVRAMLRSTLLALCEASETTLTGAQLTRGGAPTSGLSRGTNVLLANSSRITNQRTMFLILQQINPA
jgi:hypothetical protein